MVAAFFAELVYLNRLEGLTHCALDTYHIAKDVQAIVHDIQIGDEGSAFDKAINAALVMADAVKMCREAPDEAKALSHWFVEKAGTKQRLVDAASANTLVHSQEIQQHVEEVWATFFKFD